MVVVSDTIQIPTEGTFPPNKFAADCARCGKTVKAGEGLRCQADGHWIVWHRGECPKRANLYGKDCAICGRWVAPGEGVVERTEDDEWGVYHPGDCPSAFPFPEGRYAVENDEGELRFYHCAPDGEVYVMASDNEHLLYHKAAHSVIAKITLDPLEASRKFGWEFRRCGLCNRGLTNKASREAGIGPVCANKGWG